MNDLLITHARIITPQQVINSGWLLARDGKIAAIGSEDAPNIEGVQHYAADGHTLLPGFIDVHVHGAVGADTMDGTVESLAKMSAFFAKQGVTGFLPTTLTASHDDTTVALQAIKSAMAETQEGAAILGCHLEGPYLNLEQSGAQNTDYIRRADKAEATSYLDVEVIRLLSLAPEFEENHWLIRECVERGITVSTAHTDATYDETRAGIDMGISHATHTYSAMRGLHHRQPGTLGAVMEADNVKCELISDNIHAHPAAMNILWKIKGHDRIVLITDSMMAAGMGEGRYELGGYAVNVADGRATLVSTGSLAGSIITLNKAVYNFMQATGEPIENIWQTMSLNPARAVNLGHCKGSLEIGKDADMVLVDAETVDVKMTVVNGRVVYDAQTERVN